MAARSVQPRPGCCARPAPVLRRPRLCATAEHAVAEPAAEALAGPVVSSAPAPMPDAQPAAPSPPPTLVPVLPAAPERRLSLSLVSAPSPLATLSLASGDLEGLVGAAALPAALLLLFAASAALGYGAGTQAGGPAGPARAVLSAPPVRSAASVDDDPALLRARAEAAESALSEVSSRLRELRAALRQTDSERASFAEQAAEANDQLELLTEEVMLLREIIAERDGQARSTEVLIDSLQTMVAAREAQQGGGGGGKRDE